MLARFVCRMAATTSILPTGTERRVVVGRPPPAWRVIRRSVPAAAGWGPV